MSQPKLLYIYIAEKQLERVYIYTAEREEIEGIEYSYGLHPRARMNSIMHDCPAPSVFGPILRLLVYLNTDRNIYTHTHTSARFMIV